ncbi:MAG TPA: PP2C family protein-serine/threonine phosphatase [Verrucomicrobiae bacterium]|nr:PP2C family protein-serine/threonine phosphatase [Verrucomicrobiae bacterium]
MTIDGLVVDVSQDWVLACDVQQRFMEGGGWRTPALDYSARCRQIRAVGGDCYDFIALADDRLALVVGDASGKSLAAALMIANVQSSLRTAALFTGNDVATLLTVVNRQAYASSLADRYATVFYGLFDAATSTLRYVNAGHNPPFVLRPDGSIEWLEPGGAPVGMFPDSTYEERVLNLRPGDQVVAYTDGVIETTSPAGEEWGTKGLLKAMVGREPQHPAMAQDLVQAIFKSMDDFSCGCQTDDATVAVMRLA